MFLLNRKSIKHITSVFSALHPIMFLLNRLLPPLICSRQSFFTSHYVPIKSLYNTFKNALRVSFTSHYVHIKSAAVIEKSFNKPFFTSHYVPIKSYTVHSKMYCVLTLHPIMFLLNLVSFSYGNLAKSLYIPLCSY